MSEIRFYFLDNAGGHDCRLAACILADCLSRQGYRSFADQSTVQVEADGAGHPENVFVILNEDRLSDPGLLVQMDHRAAIVVCSARPANVLRHELGRFTGGVTAVDASGIAMEEGADPVVAMLAGAARACPLLDPEAMGASVWQSFDRELPYAAHAAIRAFDLAYSQAQQAI